ncbi:PREDICTED: interleukin-1 beta-like [Crocodylus porosus]|uniref:interleukin-1 beta-like n=1 Tax=Crocodylus porosus TaxID=8502 RepID=UPI00093BE611|nr:PREDICTED: interleukin-1 beta-like [Crocodylus porosus]
MATVPDLFAELERCPSYKTDYPWQTESLFYNLNPLPSLKRGSKCKCEVPEECAEKRRRTNSELLTVFNDWVEDAVSFTNSTITSRGASTYRYAYTKKLTIRDVDHKGFILQNVQAQAQLVALHLQGSNTSQEEKLNLDYYFSTQGSSNSPVVIRLTSKNLCLCCADGSPKLQLEEVSGPMKEIKTEAQKRFLFFKIDAGDTFSFELAAHPGWFISTSKDDRQPLTSVNQTGQMAITNFFTYES